MLFFYLSATSWPCSRFLFAFKSVYIYQRTVVSHALRKIPKHKQNDGRPPTGEKKKMAESQLRRMFYVARNVSFHATERAGMRPHRSAAFCGARQQPSLTVRVPAQYRQIIRVTDTYKYFFRANQRD